MNDDARATLALTSAYGKISPKLFWLDPRVNRPISDKPYGLMVICFCKKNQQCCVSSIPYYLYAFRFFSLALNLSATESGVADPAGTMTSMLSSCSGGQLSNMGDSPRQT